MKIKHLLVILVSLFSFPALAQYGAVNGYCNTGATKIVHQGLQSSNYAQGEVPSCTVTVYLTGTSTLATLYSNSTGTPLSNPFTASPQAKWNFFALSALGLDIVLSGGTFPNIYPSPVTISDVSPSLFNLLPLPIIYGGTGQTTGIAALNALGAGPGTTPFALGYPFTAPSINTDIYLSASSDQGAQINAAVATLGGATGHGRIFLPNSTSLTWTTTATIPTGGISLLGYGPLATHATCTVAGNCLLIDCSSATCHGQTYGAAAEIANFSITGNGATGQNIIYGYDNIGWNYHDLDLDGASESGGNCMVLEDHFYWTERNRVNKVNFRYSCANSLVLYANGTTNTTYCPYSNPSARCSFGYNDIQVSMNPGAGQNGLVLLGPGDLYNGTLTLTQNESGTSVSPASGIYVPNSFSAYREWLNIRSEENGTGDIGWNIPSGTVNLSFYGHSFMDAFTNTINGASSLVIADGGWGGDYTQTTYIPESGVPYDFHAGGAYLIPSYSTNGFLNGVGLFGRFQYSSGNYICPTDGAHNGCSFMLENNVTGDLTFYQVPNTGGTSQTIPYSSLSAYAVASMAPGGTFSAPTVTGSTTVTSPLINGTKVEASGGTFSSPVTATVTTLGVATSTGIPISSAGLLVVRDETLGGSAVFIVDPNTGVQLLGTSGITDCPTACVTVGGTYFMIQFATGTVPRTLGIAAYSY